MTAYEKTRTTLSHHNLAPKKKFGQNFLVHRHTAEAIVRAGEIQADESIVEVGVGLAALTLPLAKTARHVFGIEIDSGIIRFHEQEQDLPDNVTLIHQDILKADFSELARRCGGPLKIMANLPYSISNPFIFKLIDNRQYVNKATIMLQKEVADRLSAAPGSKDYGIPSVLLQNCATVKKLMTLGPAEFHPQPKVDSVVIRIVFDPTPTQNLAESEATDQQLFERIVKVSFSQRRKTILNTLAGAGIFSEIRSLDKAGIKDLTEQTIIAAGLSPFLRPEVLTLESFLNLTRAFQKALDQTPRE
jgi:16S rRNA (adenine1518-N6/adenine1519-N6)-dimethyltransferase